jgi:hypothetical protein
MGGPLTQNLKILSMLLSFKYKFAKQKCNKIYSTVKYVEQKWPKIVILPYFLYKNLGEVKRKFILG